MKHDPLKAIIGPRPIGWISSINASNKSNLAPYSFFNAFNTFPPIIGFSTEGWKDSVRNISETGEFVWNLVSETLAEKMNATSASVPSDVDEFKLAGLNPLPSARVRPMRVGESPVSFECRLTQLIRLSAVDEAPLEAWLILGEVVMVHVDVRLVSSGIYDTVAGAPILRGGGPADYFRISEATRFGLERPR